MTMRAIPVSDGIHWVGAIDWNLRDFHGYETPRGTTYNAYIVQGAEKTALVDTVKAARSSTSCSCVWRRSSILPMSTSSSSTTSSPITTAGSARSWRRCPTRASSPAAAAWPASPSTTTASRSRLSPPRTRSIWAARRCTSCRCRWSTGPTRCSPYVRRVEDAAAATTRSASTWPRPSASPMRSGLDLALEELSEYYANILMPLGKQVAKAVEKVVESGWELDVIAPSHGVIWRGDDIGAAIEAYAKHDVGRDAAQGRDRRIDHVGLHRRDGSRDRRRRCRRREPRSTYFDLAGHSDSADHARAARRARAAHRLTHAASRNALPRCGLPAVPGGSQAQGQDRRALSGASGGAAARPSR